MPSSYTSSARFTLQATGENNNTWGVILNQGVFQLVDDNVNGRLAFTLSGGKILTSVLGATDEARMAFLDVTGGTGGTVTIPAVPKGYFVHTLAAGAVVISAGGAVSANFLLNDAGPVFSDGANVWPIMLGGKDLRTFIGDVEQALIDYINIVISGGSVALPPATGNLGKALIVRNVGGPPVETWVPDFIQTTDVQGLNAALAANLAAALAASEDLAVAFALTL